MELNSWQTAEAYGDPEDARPGMVGYTDKWEAGKLPKHLLIRPAAEPKRRPIVAKTFRHQGDSPDLLLTDDTIADFGGTYGGLSVVYRRATIWFRLYHTPNLILAVVTAVLGWASAIAAAVLAYVRVSIDHTPTADSGNLVLIGAAIVLGLGSATATSKLVLDTRTLCK